MISVKVRDMTKKRISVVGTGYVGLSTAMEIQKALDCNIPVRFLFEPEALEFKSLCKHPDYNIKVDGKYLDYH